MINFWLLVYCDLVWSWLIDWHCAAVSCKKILCCQIHNINRLGLESGADFVWHLSGNTFQGADWFKNVLEWCINMQLLVMNSYAGCCYPTGRLRLTNKKMISKERTTYDKWHKKWDTKTLKSDIMNRIPPPPKSPCSTHNIIIGTLISLKYLKGIN